MPLTGEDRVRPGRCIAGMNDKPENDELAEYLGGQSYHRGCRGHRISRGGYVRMGGGRGGIELDQQGCKDFLRGISDAWWGWWCATKGRDGGCNVACPQLQMHKGS